MKRFVYLLLCIVSFSFTANSQYYYWYKGRQIPLQKGSQHYVIYEGNTIQNYTQPIIDGGNVLSNNQNLKWAIVNENKTIDSKNVVYQIPSFFSSDTSQNIFITHRFYVKLKQAEDFAQLRHLANQYGADIEMDNDLPNWYIVQCGLNSSYNALELANIFYESGQFAVSEPEFIQAQKLDCVNDPMFNQQWNLKNTGQWLDSDIDIHYCDAHAITSGDASVIIGVYDLGVDLSHPDINLYSYSCDVNSLSSPSTIYTNNEGENDHGTACAGIIGAKTNNNLGIAGIAPDCPIMSLSFYNTSSENIKNGFITAANNGCSVISNSWHLSASSNYVNEGISYALTQGRNGKGCVIVFSAGNENRDSINYPANSNDSIIVVGAMSPCGQRCNPYSCDGESNWGSNYGNNLDIMAPGVLIRTTDNVGSSGANSTDYMTNFNGTSSACPHVAAIAGLMLSVNPHLTQKEVVDILESTAQKVGVTYNPTPNRPNGGWNYYWGYGLVDAYAAVLAAKNMCDNFIQGPAYVCDTTEYHMIRPSQTGETVSWSVNNGTLPYPHYSIIGSTNTDTILVRCEYVNIMSPANIGQNLSDTANNDRAQTIDYTKSLSVTVTKGGISDTYTKTFRMPTGDLPSVTVSNSNLQWPSGQLRTFTVTNCTNVPDSMLQWTIKKAIAGTAGNYTYNTSYSYGHSLTLAPLAFLRSSPLTITVTNLQKECGEKSVSFSYILKSGLFSLNAATDNNMLHVTISGEDETSADIQTVLEASDDFSLELWHSMYGCTRTKPAKRATEHINISGLPVGAYVLLLKENGEIVAQEKVLIQ